MAKSIMLFLENFKEGDYMCWHVCSQCLNKGKIVLCDDQKVYFMVEKTNDEVTMQHLSQGFMQYTGGNNLRLEIDAQTNYDLKTSNSGDAILDTMGRNVGFIYDYCVEDGSDNDFNDFFIKNMITAQTQKNGVQPGGTSKGAGHGKGLQIVHQLLAQYQLVTLNTSIQHDIYIQWLNIFIRNSIDDNQIWQNSYVKSGSI